jgi:hypothetical protein
MITRMRFKAMCILSLFLSLNALTIIGYYKTLVEHSDHVSIPSAYEIIIIISIGVVNYFFFLKDKKYELMYEEFKKNTSMSGARGTRITVLYIIITLAMLFSLIWLSRIN